MAYDPNDPADKKIVKDAVEKALEELRTEHETEIVGLKNKNKELLGKLKDAQEGRGDPKEIARLEEQIEALQGQIKDAGKAQKAAEKALKEATDNLNGETAAVNKLVVENGLAEALVKVGVAPHFMPAVKSLLAPQVSIKRDGENRVAVVGDKSLGDFVTAWSQGDDGKHYVAAPNNSGGNAPGAKGGGSGQTMKRSEYEAKMAAGQFNPSKFFADGGALIEG